MGVVLPNNASGFSSDASTTMTEQEFAYSLADFNRVRELIYARAGINLHSGKQAMVYSRLSRRLRETGYKSFASYLHMLESASGAAAEREWQEFINCLTTNLTSFFREEHHFHELSKALIDRVGRPIRIWCNAASTGEEPYSLAMTVVETLGDTADVKVICSDIDTKVLTVARQGIYPADSRGLTTERIHRHFLRGKGENSGRIRIRPEVARLVEFRIHNLMDSKWSLGETFDFVFCRNVMIYFDDATQRKVLERIHGVMKPSSLLFAGHSENFSDSKDLFYLRGKTVYARVSK